MYVYTRFARSEGVAHVMKITFEDMVYSHPILNATSFNHSNDEIFFFSVLALQLALELDDQYRCWQMAYLVPDMQR